jgi:hypothetical protein
MCSRIPGVSIRSTPGYWLSSLRDEDGMNEPDVIAVPFFLRDGNP